MGRPRFPTALPPVWNLPWRRNPDFTGREAELVEGRWVQISERTTVETDAPVHGDPEPSHRHSSFEPTSEPREHQWRASDKFESAAESRGYTRTDLDSTTQAPHGQPFESVAA